MSRVVDDAHLRLMRRHRALRGLGAWKQGEGARPAARRMPAWNAPGRSCWAG